MQLLTYLNTLFLQDSHTLFIFTRACTYIYYKAFHPCNNRKVRKRFDISKCFYNI